MKSIIFVERLMNTLKLMTGKYRHVFQQLKMPGFPSLDYEKTMCATNTKISNEEIIEKDLPRQYVVDFAKTEESFREKWRSPDVALHYAQGNMSGSAVSKTILDTYIIPQTYAKKPRLLKSSTLCFGYYEKDDVCGFSISYVDEDPSIWSASLMKKSTMSPDDIDVISISSAVIFTPEEEMDNPDYFDESFIKTGNVKKYVSDNLFKKINNDDIRKLLKNIIHPNGRANVRQIAQLQARITGRVNIDDRDIKNLELKNKIDGFKQKLPNCLVLNTYFNDIIERSKKDIHFFEDANYAKLMSKLDAAVYPEILSVFKSKLEKFKVSSSDKERKLYQEGLKLIHCMQKVNLAKPGSAATLINVVERCSRAIDEPSDKENMTELAKLSEKISYISDPFWRALGSALLMFAGVVLFAFGVLAAIPSAGSSLLFSVLGAGIIATSVGGAAAVAGAGAAMQVYGRNKNTNKSLTYFKTALEEAQGTISSFSSSKDNAIKTSTPIEDEKEDDTMTPPKSSK